MAKPSLTKTCGCCGETKQRDAFHQEPYKTRWGKDSIRYIGTCQTCIDLGQFKVRKIEKRCIYCKEIKPAAEFYRHEYTTRTGKTSTRFVSRCKACGADVNRKWRLENYEQYHERVREYEQRNREQIAERKKRYKAANRDKVLAIQRKAHLKYMYGLTSEELRTMERAQHGVCAICKEVPSGIGHKRRLHIDHCHVTDKVRGLLCHQCNVSLGLMKEDPVRIQSMLEYVLSYLPNS